MPRALHRSEIDLPFPLHAFAISLAASRIGCACRLLAIVGCMDLGSQGSGAQRPSLDCSH